MTTGPLTRRPRSTESRRARRALVLIASSDVGFEQTLAPLLDEAGFRAAHPLDHESASITFTRTQPSVLVCDFETPTDLVHTTVSEAVTRAVPVLLLLRGACAENARGHAVAPGVTCASFPGDAAALRTLLGALLSPEAPPAPSPESA